MFGEICQGYLEFIGRNSQGDSCVVFDGYPVSPTAHIRRIKGICGQAVIFSLDTPCKIKKDVFLTNLQNKQKLIYLLGEYLSNRDVEVLHANDDADTNIVNIAIEKAKTKQVVLFGEDTYLLVLLCHHYKTYLQKIIFRSALRKNIQHEEKEWDIEKTCNMLGKPVCYVLPSLHALTGCDTTSRMYGISKSSALKMLSKNERFKNQCLAFSEATDIETIQENGEQLIAMLYGTRFRLTNCFSKSFLLK